MKQKPLCLLFGATAATVSRAKRLGFAALRNIFNHNRNDERWKISWPTPDFMDHFNQMVRANTTNAFEAEVIDGVFGFVDGSNLSIYNP